MPNKQPLPKAIGVSDVTYADIQEIAKQLSTEKGMPVRLTHAMTYIVNFYKENHQKGKK